MRWIARELGVDTHVNVMAQYHPACRVSETEYQEIDRCITRNEFQLAIQAFYAAELIRLDAHSISRLRMVGCANVPWTEE